MIQKSKSLIIGLIVEDVFTDFAKDIIQNVLKAIPDKKNIELVVIAGKFVDYDGPDDIQKKYKIVFNSIYRLEEICKFDGLLIALGSMAKIKRQILDEKYFSKLADIPKVFMVSEVESMISVNYDNETGIREAVDYLVNVCNLNRFAMLGGREDNVDSRLRKSLYIKCLKNKNIEFSEECYEPTDMSIDTEEEATRLLNRCPDAQAIFCVNDAVATGLYKAMKKKDLVPGKDIQVFGFDNTRMAGDMIPSLATIGADSWTLGQKALELLLLMISGEEVQSAKIPTRLYGRDSLNYEMYEYSMREMQKVDENFIYRMFDDCFYRYRYEHVDTDGVNLRRLFYEFISRMLIALNDKYLSEDEYEEIRGLIRIFFENGAMDYTDAAKFTKSMMRLQTAINDVQKHTTGIIYLNKLFMYMRDYTIIYLSKKTIAGNNANLAGRRALETFLIECTDFNRDRKGLINTIVNKFDKLGLDNAALFMFDTPTIYDYESEYTYPEEIRLRCYSKNGELYVLPKDRQKGPLDDMFRREEIWGFNGFIAFPILFKEYIYGILVCEISKNIAEEGEYIADQLGRTIYINQTQENIIIGRERLAFSQIAESLATRYEVVYHINVADGDYTRYRADEEEGNLKNDMNGKDFFNFEENPARKLIHPDDIERLSSILTRENITKLLKQQKHFSIEYRHLNGDNVQNMRLTAMLPGNKTHFVMGVENINEEIEKEEEYYRELSSEREMARRDELTGIKNKNAYQEFEESIQKRIDAKAEILPFAMLVCDINNLKQINDTLGHKAGDEHIKSACKLICDSFSHSPVFRVGGDEFVAVLSGEDFFERDKKIKKFRNKIIKNIKVPNGVVIATGMSEFDTFNDKKISDVFERADTKMYENKKYLKYIK
ncbi:MAG: diguanylate cyclase [Lachnospiraceae bacterium]|nr:diguanylate cyclase [Lachnospiraceae bacterium]